MLIRMLSGALLAAVLAGWGIGDAAAQTTHDVTVGNNFFSPNDLTINVGDTVRWTNPAGGPNHDVTADDFSFASQTSASFVYQRTFNSVAEILYHCTVHSIPGANRNTNMNGRVTVVMPPEFVFGDGFETAGVGPP